MDLAFESRFLFSKKHTRGVSILVLMDLAFEYEYGTADIDHPVVSILVLMDLAFEYRAYTTKQELTQCFNPCFNGSCIRMQARQFLLFLLRCFNPCFNGSCIRIKRDILRPQQNRVSILVLMDLAFEWFGNNTHESGCWCFNPCFNGSCIRIKMLDSFYSFCR